jgi:hypothetical protein
MDKINRCLRQLTLLISITITSSSLFAQSDFRNVKWGMSLDEVKRNETAPLTEESKSLSGYRDGQHFYNGVDLVYENCTVSERAAKIIYHFTNGKLAEIRVVFTATVAQKFDGSMSKIISYYKPVFDNFNRKGFIYKFPLNCSNDFLVNPNYSDERNTIIRKMKDWQINERMLELIDEMILDNKYKYVHTRLESPRTYCTLFFSTKHEESQSMLPFVFLLNSRILS